MRSPDMTCALRAAAKRGINVTNAKSAQLRFFSCKTGASRPIASAGLRCAVRGRTSPGGLISGFQPSGPFSKTSPVGQAAPFSKKAWSEVDPEEWKLTTGETDLIDGVSPISLTYPGWDASYPIPRHWLRDSCTCSKCVDPSSGQKLFSTYDVPDKLPIAEARKTEDASMEITWKDDFLSHDNHVSVYPTKTIPSHLKAPVQKEGPGPASKLWNRDEMEKLAPFFNYDEFIQGGSEYHVAFSRLISHGLFFLRNVPHDEKAVERIAERIGTIQETFYGRTWDVVSKPNAENVAYTSSYLKLHADLLYMTSPPQIQFLHCLKNTCEGGDSTFSDGLRASQQLKASDKGAWELLTQYPIHYWYNNGVHQRSKHRPVLARFQPIVYWSPQFQCPEQTVFLRNKNYYPKWLSAARKFKELLEADEYRYQYKLKEGECAVFNNLRALHGRQEFDTSTGERWFKGTYVDESYLDTCREILPNLENEERVPLDEQATAYNNVRSTVPVVTAEET